MEEFFERMLNDNVDRVLDDKFSKTGCISLTGRTLDNIINKHVEQEQKGNREQPGIQLVEQAGAQEKPRQETEQIEPGPKENPDQPGIQLAEQAGAQEKPRQETEQIEPG